MSDENESVPNSSSESEENGANADNIDSGIEFEIPKDIPAHYATAFYTSYSAMPFDSSIEILFARYAFTEKFAAGGDADGHYPAKGQVIVKMPMDVAVQISKKIMDIVSKLPEQYHEALGVKFHKGNEEKP